MPTLVWPLRHQCTHSLLLTAHISSGVWSTAEEDGTGGSSWDHQCKAFYAVDETELSIRSIYVGMQILYVCARIILPLLVLSSSCMYMYIHVL